MSVGLADRPLAGIRVGAAPEFVVQAAREVLEGKVDNTPQATELHLSADRKMKFDPTTMGKDVWKRAAEEIGRVNDTMTIEEQREMAANIMERVANGEFSETPQAIGPSIARNPMPNAAPITRAQPAYAVMPPISMPGLSPISEPQPQASSMFTRVQQAQTQTAQAISDSPSAPSFAVKFEIRIDNQEVPGKFEAYFHQIIGNDDILVFKSDNRVSGYPKYFFKADPNRQIEYALQIIGQDWFYIGVPTEYQYLDEPYTVSIVKILHKVPAPQE